MSYEKQTVQMIGKIAEIDLKFRQGKIEADEAWEQTQKVLEGAYP